MLWRLKSSLAILVLAASSVCAQTESQTEVDRDTISIHFSDEEIPPPPIALDNETSMNADSSYFDSFLIYGDSCCDSNCWGSLLGLSRMINDRWYARGWVAQGFTGNPASPTNNSNLPVTFNDRANEYQMNQFYVSVGRGVNDAGCNWDLGGRVDLLYGTDYYFTMATGLETHRDGSPKWNSGTGPRGAGAGMYGLALPQAYAEVFAPWGNGLSAKFGHFYSTLGLESVMATENFFYSRSYAMQYGRPLTHTGALATYQTLGGLEFQGGFTRGWDTWDVGQLGFLGGVNWTSCDEGTMLRFAITTGDEEALPPGPPSRDNRTAYSLILMRRISCRTVYALEHVLGVEEDAVIGVGGGLESGSWYGINQYLFHQVSDTMRAGLRVEWFKDDDNVRVLGIPIAGQTSGGDYCEITAGLNWQPNSWMNVRPEIRYDVSNARAPLFGRTGVFDSFTEDDQLTLAVDVIIDL